MLHRKKCRGASQDSVMIHSDERQRGKYEETRERGRKKMSRSFRNATHSDEKEGDRNNYHGSRVWYKTQIQSEKGRPGNIVTAITVEDYTQSKFKTAKTEAQLMTSRNIYRVHASKFWKEVHNFSNCKKNYTIYIPVIN